MFEKMQFIMSQAWGFLSPLIRVMMTQAGAILARTALQAVAQVELSMSAADGPAKRARVFEQVKYELSRQGIALATSTINAAIEAAVVKLAAR